ncbi:TolC family outer membrane protein [Achromobacter kerstersii]|uniref:TolC family outer membrane protein n=1 Tax=Achromobacter kerstersii TaxID=1353890 RepID=UPI0006C36701|nr:TolC family outer membrane protein [Achromobacter kerstersii]CUJ32234.1 Outer membrane protein tolC precursor [Achromobacter kerstersii]
MTDNDKLLFRPAPTRTGMIALAVLTAMGMAGCAAQKSAPAAKADTAPMSASGVATPGVATPATATATAAPASGVQTESGTLKMGQRTPEQDSGFGKTTPSAQMDDVAPSPAPRFDETTVLPAPVSYLPQDNPAYNGAQLPDQTDPMTLDQVYMMALQNDPQLQGAYQELQAVGYGVTSARAGLLPSVTGEVNRSRVKQNVVDSENAVYQTGRANWAENGWALTLNQPIFELGAYHKWRQAQDAERKEVASYAYAQQDLMLRTATAYLSVLAAQDQVELTEAERRTTQKQMELVQARYHSGQETRVGLSEVQARLDIQDANTLLARNDYLDKQQAIQEIIGYGNLKLRPVRKDLPMTLPAPNDAQAWLRTALDQNWSIRAASAGVAVAEKEVAVQKAGYYPSVNLRASTGRNETGGSLFGGGSTVADTRFTVNLSVPIFQGGYTYGMSHAAASRLSAASSDLSLTRRKVQRQVFSSFQNIVIGVDRIRALNSSVESFELALKLKEEGFTAGLNDIVSVLDASRNLYNAKRQQAEAGYNFVLDGLKLKQAAGTLNAADIAAISQQIL